MPTWNSIREWTGEVKHTEYWHIVDVVWEPSVCASCGGLILPLTRIRAGVQDSIGWATFGSFYNPEGHGDLRCYKSDDVNELIHHQPDEFATVMFRETGMLP